jgi:hypothetical protein
VLVIAAAVAAALTPVDPDATADGHGWRGAYYRDLLFLGEPVVRRERVLLFDWRRGSPFPERRPRDRFSVRWDACLELPARATIELTLTSDDGSRAFVDGERFVDNWGDHGLRARAAAVALDAGPHHVQVEYYEKSRDARIHARITLPERDGEPIPRDWLRIPELPHHHPDVCAPDEEPSDPDDLT